MQRALAVALFVLCMAASARAEELSAPGVHELDLSEPPHAPGDAPDVIAHVPRGYDPQGPLDVVVFLHGFDCCARSLVAAAPVPCESGKRPHRAWDLAGIHDAAGTQTILLVPQLAYLERTARNHRFVKHGAFDAMLREVLAGPLAKVLGPRALDDVRSATLVAHSGGYGALVPILRDPNRKTRVQSVVLLDALYAGAEVFAAWARAEPDSHLVSLHTAQAETTRGSEQLARGLEGKAAREITGTLAQTLRTHRWVIVRVTTPHADVPARHLAEVLRGLPFAARTKADIATQAP